MQTATEQIHFIGDDFLPDGTTPYQLAIDGTAAGEPLLALFDQQNDIKFFGSMEVYDRRFPEQPLSSLKLESIRGVVPEIDLMLFPIDLYDDTNWGVYSAYLRDDGVTEIKVRESNLLNHKFLYRERVDSMAAILNHFASLETIPLSSLLLNALAEVNHGPVLGIHRGDDTVIFYLSDNNDVVYHHAVQVTNEDEFNYYLIQVLTIIETRNLSANLLLSGNLTTGDSYYERIIKYVSSSQILDPAQFFGLRIPERLRAAENMLIPVCLLAGAGSVDKLV